MMPMIPIAADLVYVPPTIHDVDYYGKHSPAPGRTLWTVMRSEADETRHLRHVLHRIEDSRYDDWTAEGTDETDDEPRAVIA